MFFDLSGEKNNPIWNISLVHIFFAFCNPTTATAQSPSASDSAIIITPTFQEITLNPDDATQTTQIEVFNQSSEKQTFEVFAVSVDQIDDKGNFTLSDKPLSDSDSPDSAFITFSNPELEILPNQVTSIPFTIINSQNLSPGGNYAVVIVRAKPEQTDVQPNQSVLPAVSSFVLIRKMGGEQYNLSLLEISTDHQLWWQLPKTLTMVFENQGNIHTIPRGQIKIADVFDNVVVEGTINESSQFVFPRTQKELSVQLRQIRPSWPIMLYTITVRGESSPGEIPFLQQSFSVFVSYVGLIIAVLVGGLFSFFVWFLQKTLRKKR